MALRSRSPLLAVAAIAALAACALWASAPVASVPSPTAPSPTAPSPTASGGVSLEGAIGAIAAVVLLSRARDARHLPRLVLHNGSGAVTVRAWAAAVVIYGYERAMAAVLQLLGLTRMPSTLAAMLCLFAALRILQRWGGRGAADWVALILQPGVDLLGKWMGLFLAPPLASLDASIAALPPYEGGVWVKTVMWLALAWAATHSVAAAVATQLAPRRERKAPQVAGQPATARAVVRRDRASDEVPVDEAVRRSWVLLAAVGVLGVSCSGALPVQLQRPLAMLCQAGAMVGAFTLAKLLPDPVQRVLHPLVLCAVAANLSSRFVGPSVPYFDGGRGVGDRFFQWLPAAVAGLGVRMYSTTGLWLDNAGDFRCVLLTCAASACFSLLATVVVAVAPASPLHVPAPLSLPLLHRSVMSALGIEGSLAIGPECDPKLAVAAILITGCLGASLGSVLFGLLPTAVADGSSPLVRGLATGCSAHSIGTAGLIADGNAEAAAIAGAAMCLAGTAHVAILQLPGLVPALRALAALPALAASSVAA